ncbi:hypothetical protein CDD82_2598 [Ophiocordyceps australis]|uniref:ATP-dependent RNA helicase n=1 Tax=Ophiocordyceps australis TaxID=1399860 RepID=A0A2C5XR98_9HYPO|nr:hypothetical protein CDD82_2598 [Ophiocordyceps australis]
MVSLKKRKLVAGSGPAPKRSKREDETRRAKKLRGDDKAEGSRAKSRRRVVDVSSLAWKPVGEEFGGLQVIKGVQVVKHGDKVEFLVNDTQDGQDGTAEESEGQEESFEGFGDDAVEGKDFDSGKAGPDETGVEGEEPHGQESNEESAKTKTREQVGQRTKAKQSKKQADAALEAGISGTQAGNSFEPLVGMAQDDKDVDVAEWEALNLSRRMLSCVAGLGFAQPTQIQKMAIPEIIAGEDVIGKAQTGSGKTLAFGIPIVEKWLRVHEGVQDDDDEEEEEEEEEQKKEDKKHGCIMAVVLSPTRELAKQLGDHIKALCRQLDTAPRICVVTGGLSIQKQQRQLAQANIIMATPGRLWEDSLKRRSTFLAR